MCRVLVKVVMVGLIFLTFPSNIFGEQDEPSPHLIESEYFEQDQRLKVGFVPDSPPFQFIRDGDYVGFNIDAMNYIAVEQGINVHYIPMTREQGVASIQDGSIDVLLGVPFTEEFSQSMEFTDAFVTSSIGVLVPSESDIENLSDLQGNIVALQLNTLEYDFVKNIRNVHVHVAHDQSVAVRIITKGRADAFIGNHLTVEYLLEENNLKDDYYFIENYLLPLDYSFAVKKENYSLLHRLNIGIRHFKLSNEYATIYSKWFGELETPLSKQLKLIRDILIVIVGVAIIIFWLGLRWNRQLQKEVNKKTKDLQVMNESLMVQVKKTEESDQTKEQILESSVRGIITIDIDGIILTINSVACQLFKTDRTVIGKHIRSVIFAWDVFDRKIKDVSARKHGFTGQELNVSQYLDTIEYISYDIQPFYSIKQEIIGTLLSFEDITEERKLKEQLYDQEKSRALIQLVAGIAHEIRNPLTSIKTFVEMIPIKMNNKQFRNEIATHVPKEIDRLNQLVEGLINYAKPKSENKALINMSTVVNFVALLFESKINNKGYRLVKEIEDDLFVQVDENQIKQVLINLVLNAIESMDNKTKGNRFDLTIYIRLYSKYGFIFIEVEDEGVGMATEMADRVFEPFYTTKSEGTGLGLALSRQFIVENNGEITLESELGQYSKFQLRFPKKEVYDAKSINY